MPIDVLRLPDEPIIVTRFAEPFDVQQDVPAMFDRVAELRTEIAGNIYFLVIDISQIKQNFSDMVFTLGEARNRIKELPDDSDARMAIVGKGMMTDLAAKAMQQPQYGGRKMVVYTSYDDALSSIRATVAG